MSVFQMIYHLSADVMGTAVIVMGREQKIHYTFIFQKWQPSILSRSNFISRTKYLFMLYILCPVL